jgi:hypothetical protein
MSRPVPYQSSSDSPAAAVRPQTRRVVLNLDAEACQVLARRAPDLQEMAQYITRLLREEDARHQSQPAPRATKRYEGRSPYKQVFSLVFPEDAVEILQRRAPGTSDWARYCSRLIFCEEVRQEMRPDKGVAPEG